MIRLGLQFWIYIDAEQKQQSGDCRLHFGLVILGLLL